MRLGGGGESAVFLFVDSGTGLPRGLSYKAPSPLGLLDAATCYRSYRDVAGVKMPDIFVFVAAGQQTEITIDEFRRG